MKKNSVIMSLVALCIVPGLLNAFPKTVMVENKSKSTVGCTFYTNATSGERISQDIRKNSTSGFGSPDGFKKVNIYKKFWFSEPQIFTFDLSLYHDWVTLVYDGTKITDESQYEQDQQSKSKESYFAALNQQRIAAQMAAAQRFAKTRTWFSDIWESIKTKFARMFVQPNIKIVNKSDIPIVFGHIYTKTLLGYESESATLASGAEVTYSFSRLRYDTVQIHALNIDWSTLKDPQPKINIKPYRDSASQHRDDELLIVIKGIKNGVWEIEQPVWQKKSTQEK